MDASFECWAENSQDVQSKDASVWAEDQRGPVEEGDANLGTSGGFFS